MSEALVEWREQELARHFRLTATGLVIEGQPSFGLWELAGERLRAVSDMVNWWIGDWLNYGERRWGETYAQALDETDLSLGTLRNIKYVAGRVEVSRRRDLPVTFSHHQEVAPLEPEEQTYWLDRAEEERLTRDDLRQAIKESRNPGNPAPDPLVVMVRPIEGGVSVQCVRPEAGFTHDCFSLQEAQEAFGYILEDEGWEGRFKEET